jgi:hypothetical protein
MGKPLLAMTLHELVMLGNYHVAALKHTEETKGLIGEFAKVLDVLEGASAADRRAQQELSAAGVPVKFAEYETHEAIRRVALLACGPDGSETPLYQALFPFGIEVTLATEGQSLLTDAFILGERLVHLRAAMDLKAQVRGELEEALAKLSQLLAAQEQAEIVATRAREHAEKSRTEFLAAYERNAVAIEKLFPDSQRQQDIYFDERHVDHELMTAEADWWPATEKKGGGRPS